MRFLVDECTGPKVAAWLRVQGHEVFSVFDEARGVEDDTVIQKAHDENWILITNDKDFGGVIFMRLEDERAANKIDVLRRLLEGYADRVEDQFIVVSETRVRFARG
jgi:predicted nuclease of predicted toxin-antitoxin system